MVLVSVFTSAQAPGPSTSNTQSSSQQNISEKVKVSTDETLTASPDSPNLVEKVGHGVSAPVPIKTPQAKYTSEARKKKIQGACLVRLIVDANGNPQNLKLVRSIGYGLDEAALEAVKKYRFKPAMRSGQTVAVEMAIEVNFRLY